MISIPFEEAKIMSFDKKDYLMIPIADMDDRRKVRIFVDGSKGKHIAEIKRYSRKRSGEMNRYCWVLCEKLAVALSKESEEPYTKINVYTYHIMKVGSFTEYSMHKSAFEDFKKAWKLDRLGRVAEMLDDDRDKPGNVLVAAYKGSSEYNTDEMGRLLDSIIYECQAQGIETMTPNEIERMKRKDIDRAKQLEAKEHGR